MPPSHNNLVSRPRVNALFTTALDSSIVLVQAPLGAEVARSRAIAKALRVGLVTLTEA